MGIQLVYTSSFSVDSKVLHKVHRGGTHWFPWQPEQLLLVVAVKSFFVFCFVK